MAEPDGQRGLQVGEFAADPAFFEVLRIRMAAGRSFVPGDHESSAPVAVISRSLADRMGPLETVVGRELSLGSTTVRIVGVAENVRFGGPFEGPAHRYEVYRPLAQSPHSVVSLFAVTEGDAASLVPLLSRGVTDVAPTSAIDWVGPIDGWLRERVGETRFVAVLFTVFGLASTALAALGMVGITAAGVARRRRELAIRQILGGTAASLKWALASQAMKLAAAGGATGIVTALVVGRWSESAVGEIQVTDPAMLAAASGLLIAAAGLAAWIPARRVTDTDPAVTVKE